MAEHTTMYDMNPEINQRRFARFKDSVTEYSLRENAENTAQGFSPEALQHISSRWQACSRNGSSFAALIHTLLSKALPPSQDSFISPILATQIVAHALYADRFPPPDDGNDHKAILQPFLAKINDVKTDSAEIIRSYMDGGKGAMERRGFGKETLSSLRDLIESLSNETRTTAGGWQYFTKLDESKVEDWTRSNCRPGHEFEDMILLLSKSSDSITTEQAARFLRLQLPDEEEDDDEMEMEIGVEERAMYPDCEYYAPFLSDFVNLISNLKNNDVTTIREFNNDVKAQLFESRKRRIDEGSWTGTGAASWAAGV